MLAEAAVDGSLDFLHVNSLRAAVLCVTSLQHHYQPLCGGRSDTATTRILLVILGELSPGTDIMKL